MKKKRWLVVLGCVLTGFTGSASAQESAAPAPVSADAGETGIVAAPAGEKVAAPVGAPPEAAYAEYEAALSEALAAHARGDYGQARIFMERAHALEPSARTLRGLGIVAFAQGRHRDCIQHLDASLASSEKPLPQDLRSSVEELLSHAWGQVGRIQISVDPPSGRFLIDGREPELYAPGEVVLAPGRHSIKVSAPERPDYALTIDVKAGDSRTLQLVLAQPPAKIIIERYALAPVGERGPAAITKKQRLERLAWASGATLMASGAAIYGLAYFRLNQLKDRCEDRDAGVCTQARANRLYGEKNIEGLGIAAAVVAGTGLVATAVATIMRVERARAREKAQPRIDVGFGSVFVSGRF